MGNTEDTNPKYPHLRIAGKAYEPVGLARCARCHGTGRITEATIRTGYQPAKQTKCPVCNGAGAIKGGL